MRRDDFPAPVKRLLAERVGYICSNPTCRAQTSGPQLEQSKSDRVGDAAHITAASAKGPRFDPSMTREQRRSHGNGIWLCVVCARLVDQDKSRYSVEELRRWKADAEAEAKERLGRPRACPSRRSAAT